MYLVRTAHSSSTQQGGIMERLRRRACLFTGLCLTLVCLGVSSPSYAIPIAGNYTFTNGLTGTFTSDGNKLTAWNITIPSLSSTVFCKACGLDTPTNGSAIFVTANKAVTPNEELSIFWSTNSWSLQLETLESGTFTFKANTAGVPEPSAVLLLASGLIVLSLYGWQQRRPTAIQTN